MDVVERVRIHAALGDPHRLAMVDALRLGDRTFQELATTAGLPGNLAAHHLSVLEEAGLLDRRISEGDRRRRYLSLRSERLDAVDGGPHLPATFVVFVCTHNSARSQFASALWRARTGGQTDSAGTTPAAFVHPLAVAVAAEHDIDLRSVRPKAYADLAGTPGLVVSVCDRAHEAGLPIGVPALHWSIPDPVADGSRDAFRAAFGTIVERVDRLAAAVAPPT